MASSNSGVGGDGGGVSSEPAKRLRSISDSEDDDRSAAADESPADAIDDDHLLNLDIKDLNRLMKQLDKKQQAAVKQRRRTLKNRGYAQSCRSKRQARADHLDSKKADLEKEIKKIREELRQAEAERDNSKAELFQSIGVNANNPVSVQQFKARVLAVKESVQRRYR